MWCDEHAPEGASELPRAPLVRCLQPAKEAMQVHTMPFLQNVPSTLAIAEAHDPAKETECLRRVDALVCQAAELIRLPGPNPLAYLLTIGEFVEAAHAILGPIVARRRATDDDLQTSPAVNGGPLCLRVRPAASFSLRDGEKIGSRRAYVRSRGAGPYLRRDARRESSRDGKEVDRWQARGPYGVGDRWTREDRIVARGRDDTSRRLRFSRRFVVQSAQFRTRRPRHRNPFAQPRRAGALWSTGLLFAGSMASGGCAS